MSRLSPKEFAELMADWANGACFEDMDDVTCHIVSITHRTLQQQVFALFLAMVQQWSECESTGQQKKLLGILSVRLAQISTVM